MSDIDAAGMSHIGPKKGIVRGRVAHAWHEGSDHAAESPFGGPLCNCWQVAGRMLPMLAEAWREGANVASLRWMGRPEEMASWNPYPFEEDCHVDQ